MNAIDLLIQDHNEVRALFKRFEDAHEAEDTEEMSTVASSIFEELEVHTTIEEEIFYPAVHDTDGDISEVVDEGVQEHHADEEEKEMFPDVREELGEERLNELGEQMEERKATAKADSATKDELYEKAKSMGIEGRSEMTKAQLAEAVGA